MPIDVANLGRPDDLPFGVALRDLFARGHVARTHPLTRDPVAVAGDEQFEAWHSGTRTKRTEAFPRLQRLLSAYSVEKRDALTEVALWQACPGKGISSQSTLAKAAVQIFHTNGRRFRS